MNYSEHRSKDHPIVTLTVKDYGSMVIELFPEIAPNTVNNFIYHIQNNYYPGLIFHRIIPGFMIQGGGGKKMRPIKGEFEMNGFQNPLHHLRGVISMARTSDPNSQTTQFFIMHQTAPHLNRQYAAFGGLIEGFDVLDRIATVACDQSDRPKTDVVIESVSIDLKGYLPKDPVFI